MYISQCPYICMYVLVSRIICVVCVGTLTILFCWLVRVSSRVWPCRERTSFSNAKKIGVTVGWLFGGDFPNLAPLHIQISTPQLEYRVTRKSLRSEVTETGRGFDMSPPNSSTGTPCPTANRTVVPEGWTFSFGWWEYSYSRYLLIFGVFAGRLMAGVYMKADRMIYIQCCFTLRKNRAVGVKTKPYDIMEFHTSTTVDRMLWTRRQLVY